MIEKLLDASIRFRWGVVILTLIISAYGLSELMKLPIDAVPDITNKQVQINTVEPNLGPLDIERLVTFPVETAMAGIPGLESSRSISRNGFSQVTVIFEDHTDLYFARQQVAERLNQAKGTLPEGVEPQMGPVSTGLGEVLMYIVDFAKPGSKAAPKVAGKPGFQPDGSYMTPSGEILTEEVAKLGYLRTVQDWVIRPQLRTIPGVADVNSLGGEVRSFEVVPRPQSMAARGLALKDLQAVLEANNRNDGAGRLNDGEEGLLVRAEGAIRNLDDVRAIVVQARDGRVTRVADVAEVRWGALTRYGAVSADGRGEAVEGMVLGLRGADAKQVVAGVKARLAEIEPTLPEGVPVLFISAMTNKNLQQLKDLLWKMLNED